MHKFGVKLKPTNSSYIDDYVTNNPKISEKQKKDAGLVLDNQKKGENFCQKFINIQQDTKEGMDPATKKRNYNAGLKLISDIIKKHLFAILKNLGKAVMIDYMIKLKTLEVELAEIKNDKYDLELEKERCQKENEELKEMLNIFNEKFCEMQTLPKNTELSIEKQENMNLSISPIVKKTVEINIENKEIKLKEDKKKTILRSNKKDNNEIKTKTNKTVSIAGEPKPTTVPTENDQGKNEEKIQQNPVVENKDAEHPKEEEKPDESRQTRIQKSRKLRSLLTKKGKDKQAKLLKYFKKFYFNGIICSVKKRAREKSIDMKEKKNKTEDKATKFLRDTKTLKYSKVLELSQEEKKKRDIEERKLFLLKSLFYKKDRVYQIAIKKTFQKYNLRSKIMSLNAQKLERRSRKSGKSKRKRKDKSTSIDAPKNDENDDDRNRKPKKSLMNNSVNVNLNVNKFLSSSSMDYNDKDKKDNIHVIK